MTQFAQVERELTLYLEAMLGRPPGKLAVFDNQHERHVEVAEFYVPSSINTFEDVERNRAIYLWLLIEQIAFQTFDTFEFDFDEFARRESFHTDKPAHFTHRSTELDKLFESTKHPNLASSLFFHIECARLLSRTLHKWPGTARMRLSAQSYYNVASWDPDSEHAVITYFVAALRGVTPLDPAFAGSVDRIAKESSTVFDSAYVLVGFLNTLLWSESTLEFENEEMPGEVLDLSQQQRLQKTNELEEEIAELTAMIALEAESAEQGVQSESENVDGSERGSLEELLKDASKKKRQLDIEKSLLRLSTLNDSSQVSVHRYDEWNYLERRFIPKWCVVREAAVANTESLEVDELWRTIRPHVRGVRKHFEQLRPTGLQRTRRMDDGEELDFNALIDCRLDLLAKRSPDQRIYMKRIQQYRDVSAVLLMDLSASTDDPIEDNEADELSESAGNPQDLRDPFFDDPKDDSYLHGSLDFAKFPEIQDDRKRVIDIEREAILLLATALEGLGDMYAIYGFSGYGHDNVEIDVAKQFDDRLDDVVIRNIAAFKPKRSTRMGPAIRHATERLAQTGSALKVLLVVSDGFPQDFDYGPDRSSHEYGIQDTAKAIEEAKLANVKTFNVTIDKSGNDYLRRMCSEQNYLVIEEASDLKEGLQVAYRQLTAA